MLARFVSLSHDQRLEVADGYLEDSNQYYFQRSPLLFEPILQFYATGVVHKPHQACADAFLAELDFWGINEEHIGSCCAEELFGGPLESAKEQEVELSDEEDYFQDQSLGESRKRLWRLMEGRGVMSAAAKIMEITSALFVLVSVISLSTATIPEFRVTVTRLENETANETFSRVETRTTTEDHPVFRFV